MDSGTKNCNVRLSSTWVCQTGSLVDTVIYHAEDENESTTCSSSTTDAILHRNNSEEQCWLTLSQESSQSKLISAIDILCNARYVEVYDHKDVYLATDRGTRIDKELELEGDRKLYMMQYSLPQPLPHCRIKFVSLSNPDELWIHSIHLTVVEKKSRMMTSLGMGSSVNMENVLDLMGGNTSQLPSGAVQLMNHLTNKQNSAGESVPNFGALLTGLMAGMKGQSQSPRISVTGGTPNQTAVSETLTSNPAVQTITYPDMIERSHAANSHSNENSKKELYSSTINDSNEPSVRNAHGSLKNDTQSALQGASELNKHASMSSLLAMFSNLQLMGKQAKDNCSEMNDTPKHPDNIFDVLGPVSEYMNKLVKETEDRLRRDLMDQIKISESRIMEKLDCILEKLEHLKTNEHHLSVIEKDDNK